jgi:carotenoid cleavage dioxygenase-like enzyme
MPSPIDPSLLPLHDVEIDLRGSVPQGLSGRVLGIGRDGVVHSVELRADQSVSYRVGRFRTDEVVHHVVAFGGVILAFGDDSPAYELSADLDTLYRVDLAGHRRALAPFPKHDPTTRELHLIARAADGMQAHVVVSAGALTRRSRPILDIPSRIKDLALARDHVVFVADGFVGVVSRDGEARTNWIATGVAAPHAVHAHDAGDTVVLLVLTPSLERWTVHVGVGSVRREVLDPTPRRFAHCGSDDVDEPLRVLWSTGEGTIGRHDLVASRHMHHTLRPHVPGDFVVVTDTLQPSDADSGWLVGFVHDASGTTTDLRVIEATDIAAPTIATVRLLRPIPRGLRCTWIPSTQQRLPKQSPSTKENGP